MLAIMLTPPPAEMGGVYIVRTFINTMNILQTCGQTVRHKNHGKRLTRRGGKRTKETLEILPNILILPFPVSSPSDKQRDPRLICEFHSVLLPSSFFPSGLRHMQPDDLRTTQPNEERQIISDFGSLSEAAEHRSRLAPLYIDDASKH